MTSIFGGFVIFSYLGYMAGQLKTEVGKVATHGKNCFINHYENTPIQIYRKFHFQKLKIFR